MQVKTSHKKKEIVNPLKELNNHGQSVWLDYIRRSLIVGGDLDKMIVEDGLAGITSNPAIFEKAIAGSVDYREAFKALEFDSNLGAKAVYEIIAVGDIQAAADSLKGVFTRTEGRDGYVSLEVSPELSRDTDGTCREARRLWEMVDRPNVMIKVPATPEGIPAVEQLISEGINVNVTLIFSQSVYEQVAQAYIHGLKRFKESGGDVSRVASVASFFISRIDSAVDIIVSEKIAREKDHDKKMRLMGLCGKVAVANAKMAYQRYKEIFCGERWQELQNSGGRTQRVLWASTGTKNPRYSDVLYVEELIGPDTVNTIPPATYESFRNHGKVTDTLEDRLDEAEEIMDSLAGMEISFADITDGLLEEGLNLFENAFRKLLCAVEENRCKSNPLVQQQHYSVPENLNRKIEATLEDWSVNKKIRRLGMWSCDPKLWSNTDECRWLGWLEIAENQLSSMDDFSSVAGIAQSNGFQDILLLGMGGSSLCPEVLQKIFGHIDGYPELHVLDSTDPAQIRAFENRIDLAKTLFIVSSKSGNTLEPNIFEQYFFERVKKLVGEENAGERFIAITDPGSKLQEVAQKDNFFRVFFGFPSIGGRFSALSNFGMIPAAAMGIDVGGFINQTQKMVHACAACVPTRENPGLVLGVILGVLANEGIDKITFVTSPKIYNFGAWLEQLLAESTGKEGRGLIPVDREKLGSLEVYQKDRFFVYLRFQPEPDSGQDQRFEELKKAGHAVIRIDIQDIYDLGEEFFRWEIATAVAGSVMGINPFNQPDVEASKIATRKLTEAYESAGRLPEEEAFFAQDGIKLFTDGRNAKELLENAGGQKSLFGYLKAHLDRIKDGDYFAVLAYVEMNKEHEDLLQNLRHLVRDRKKIATCLGFGPRFLHSTGQAYKGGPDTGVFLQITCDDAIDLPIPRQKYTFGVVKAAQARGDFQVMAERHRRALRIHLGKDVRGDLQKLTKLIDQALT